MLYFINRFFYRFEKGGLTTKKAVSVFCILILLCGLCSVAVSASWDDDADTSWYGSGSSYTLSSASQLAGLARLVNDGNEFLGVTVSLGSDISLAGKTWVPIGTFDGNTTAFNGTFDGAGHTISGLNLSSGGMLGLFGAVNSRGRIQHVNVSGTVSGTDNYCAGLVAYCLGSVTECSFSGTVSGVNSCGCIAGYCSGTVSGCSTSGNLSARKYVGGLIGYQITGRITDSSSSATVSASSHYAGGLVGYSSSCRFSDCSFSGSVSGLESIGGLGGHLSSGTVTRCSFEGSASGTGKTGGLAGDTDSVTFTDCTSYGSVRGEQSVGGLVGGMLHGSILNSFSLCAVSSSSTGGGITGSLSGTVDNCFFAGSISGSKVGAISGSSTGTITNCFRDSSLGINATGDGVNADCAIFTKKDCSWALDRDMLGQRDMLHALNQRASQASYSTWYATDSYPAYSGGYRLILKCVDASGTELMSEYHVFSAGEDFELKYPEFDGFVTEEKVLKGTMPAAEKIVEVKYTGDKFILTVHYLYNDGLTAAPDYKETIDTNAEYQFTPPVIEGYQPDVPVIKGKMPAENLELTVTYSPSSKAPSVISGKDSHTEKHEEDSPEVEIQTESEDPPAPQISSMERYPFIFWFLISMLVMGSVALVLLLCMFLNPEGKVMWAFVRLMYPEERKKRKK